MLELADTSAWYASRRDPGLREEFSSRVGAAQIATCDMVKLELLKGARNPGEFRQRREELDLLPQCPIGLDGWRRALAVYEGLCRSGPGNDYHSRVPHPDLLIAAAAEAAGVPVLHYDEDFDAIALVTGQEARWLAPKGTL